MHAPVQSARTTQTQDTLLRPGDRAFVIANLDFDAVAAREGASAWPEGVLGFDRDVSEETMAEFQAASAALTARARRGR